MSRHPAWAVVRLGIAVLAVATLAVSAVGCGDDGDEPSASPEPTATSTTGTDSAAPAPSGSATADPGMGPPGDALAGSVVQVVDGDTVRIDFGEAVESVRLIGIDTPEPSGGFQPTECHGDEASAFTRDLLPEGTGVLVTFDAEARDRFDRLLGYVYRAADGVFVNLRVIENGYAGPMTIEPNTTFAAAFERAASAAASAGLGLWSACDGPDDLLEPAG